MKTTKAIILTAILAGGSLNGRPAEAQLDKLKLSEQIQQVTFGGDLRLRSDRSSFRGEPNRAAGKTQRSRVRYRLRFGSDITLPNDLTATLRLGSGTGEQVSTNQSFDNLSGQKALWLDLASLKWTPQVSDSGSVSVVGGRMINPLWRPYSSDIVWDDDFNPEGFAQGVEWLFPEAGLTVFGNMVQGVADEDSTSGKNQWYFSEQVGAETRLPLEMRLKAAGAYHYWSDVNRSNLGPAAALQDGNRRAANGTLINRFGVAELTGQLSGWAGKLPLALQGTFIRNVLAKGEPLLQPGTGAASVCAAGQTCPTGNEGYQYGLIVGAAKAAGTWEVAAFQKYSQTDATVSDVADSDFGDGGTNSQGQIFWAAYAPTNWMQVKAKYFNVDTIDTQYLPVDKATRRLQLDLAVKF